jgi:hypothetical protein
MEIDQARANHLPRSIDPISARRNLQRRPHSSYASIGYQHVGHPIEPVGRIHNPPA